MSSVFRDRIEKAVAFEMIGTLINNEFRPQMFHTDQRVITSEKTTENAEGWHQVSLTASLLRIFTQVNLPAFVGEEQGKKLYYFHLREKAIDHKTTV